MVVNQYIENSPAATVNDKGIYISSTQPIGAMYEVRSTASGALNREAVSLKGKKALGTDFYTPFQTFWDNGTTNPKSFSSIEIVASENGTTVLITPRTNVLTGHSANVSYTVALNKGQSYSVRDTNRTAATSLAGSIVSSDKPVALTLYSGAMSQGGTLSTMMDQPTSVDYIGTDFIIRKGQGSNERVFILATQNNTDVQIFGTTTANSVINWSETQEYVPTDSVSYIKTSKPVYVWHASGFGNKLSGAQVPNVYCAGTYTTNVTRSSSDSFALVLWIRSGFENQFTINGNSALVPSSAFAVVPGTSGEFVCARISYSTTDIPVGSQVVIKNTGDVFGAGVMSGSSVNGSEYAYFSTFLSSPIVDAGNNDTTCANSSFALNGFVGGGSVTGIWSGSGFGTFQNGNSSLINNYIPSDLDTALSPVALILSSTGPCPVQRDTLFLVVNPRAIVSASADQTVCANVGSVSLNGTVSGGSTTGMWVSPNGTGSFSPNDTTLNASYIMSAADTAAGSVMMILNATHIGFCGSVNDTMYVTITNAPIVDAGPSSQSVCSNNATVSLSGTVQSASGTGKWTSGGSGFFTPNNIQLSTTYNPSQTDIQSGQTMIYFASTNNNGCIPAKDSVLILYTSAPSVDAGSNLDICKNDSTITLAGSVSGVTTTGYWSGGSGTFSPDSTALNAVYTPSSTEFINGTVQLILTTTNNGGCNSVNDQVSFNLLTPPYANFSVNNTCEGGTNTFNDFSLQGSGAITQWTYYYGTGDSAITQNTTYTYPSAGSYTATLVVGSSVGCTDSMQKVVTIYPVPVANFVTSSTCNGTQITIAFTDMTTIASPDTIKTWIWDFGGTGGAAVQNPSMVYNNQGNYQVTLNVLSSHNCSSSNVQLVNIPAHPDAAFYYNTDPGFNVGSTVSFIDSSSNAVNYYWDFGNGVTNTDENTEYTYYENGTYTVVHVVTDNIGCSDTARANVIITGVSSEIISLIPNVITPNNDGKNDVWKLPFVKLLYPKATVEIYNSWGQKIFYSDGYDSPWDGTYQGQQLPAGNYYFILNLNDSSKPDPYKGAILLLR